MQDIIFQKVPKIFNENKRYTIMTRSLKIITIPHYCLHLLNRKKLDQISPLSMRQGAKMHVIHRGEHNTTRTKVRQHCIVTLSTPSTNTPFTKKERASISTSSTGHNTMKKLGICIPFTKPLQPQLLPAYTRVHAR
jgi:hypothetical protein